MDELRPESAANDDAELFDVGGPQAGILHTLISIARSIRALLGLRLAELRLGNGQDEVMLGLEGGQSVSTAVLAARLSLRETALTRLLESLIAKGLVERVGDKRDSRRVMVRVSLAGMEMQARVREIWNEVGNDLLGTNGTEQLDRLIDELEGLQKQMDTRITRFC